MSSIAPPPAVVTQGQPVAAPNAVGSFTNLPPGLANLVAGAILTGSVIGRDAQGHVLVQTNNGVLSLSTALQLLPGNTLSLQLQTTGAQIQMVILSINQQPVPAGPQASATVALPPPPRAPGATTAAPAAPAGAPPPAESPAVLVSAGRWLTATIVEPAVKPGAAVPPAATQAATGGQVPAAVPTGILPGTPPHEALQLLTALFNRPVREPEIPQKGARLPVRIVAFEPNPGTDPETVLRTAAQGRIGARLLAGTVTKPDASGLLQVQTALGQLSISAKLGLPPQSHVVFEILGALEPPAPPAALAGANPVMHGRGWPVLEEALTVLATADPEQFRHLTEQVIPRAGADLARTVMLAAAALKSDSFAAFLGDRTLRALADAGRHDIAARLGEDVRQLMVPAHDSSGAAWRSYLIPVHDGSHLQFIRMYTRHQRRKGQAAPDSDHASRFLVEVDLSRLGALQFDGLVKAKKFDLIIRSQAPLDPAMRRDIGQIFADATATAGFAGSIAFQPGAHFAQAPTRPGGAPVTVNV